MVKLLRAFTFRFRYDIIRNVNRSSVLNRVYERTSYDRCLLSSGQMAALKMMAKNAMQPHDHGRSLPAVDAAGNE